MTIRVEAQRAVAGLRRGQVADVEDTPYVKGAIEAGHLVKVSKKDHDIVDSPDDSVQGQTGVT